MFDPSAEHAVIGSLLLRPELIRSVDLPASAFHGEFYRRAYLAMLKLEADGMGPDVHLISELTEPGDKVRLIACLDGVSKVTNFEWYCTRMRRDAYHRAVAKLEGEMRELALERSSTPDEIESERSRLARMIEDEFWPRARGIDPSGSLDRLREFYQRTEEFGVSTGIPDLDVCCGDLYPGMVVTILARPGVGKSALALNMVRRWLELPADWGVMFCSLEMPESLATDRLVRICEGWNKSETRAAMQQGIEPETFKRLTRNRYCLSVESRSTLDSIRSAKNQWEREHAQPIRCVVIDYFQYLAPAPRESLYERGSRLSREIKEFAKDENCVVVNLCQVKRGEEGGKGSGCPSLESARDSGTIEENADVLLALWRPKEKPLCLCARGLKVRQGRVGEQAELAFDFDTFRIV